MNVVVQIMGDVFPELKQHEVHIREIIAEEEETFEKTLLKVRVFHLKVFIVMKVLSG